MGYCFQYKFVQLFPIDPIEYDNHVFIYNYCIKANSLQNF